MINGIKSVIYGVTEIDLAKKWYSKVLQKEPYFDEENYVGFNVGGYELGLYAKAKSIKKKSDGVVAYWGVANIEAEFKRLLQLKAVVFEEIADVGGGIKMASFVDPFGNIFGIIHNPHFKLC